MSSLRKKNSFNFFYLFIYIFIFCLLSAQFSKHSMLNSRTGRRALSCNNIQINKFSKIDQTAFINQFESFKSLLCVQYPALIPYIHTDGIRTFEIRHSHKDRDSVLSPCIRPLQYICVLCKQLWLYHLLNWCYKTALTFK